MRGSTVALAIVLALNGCSGEAFVVGPAPEVARVKGSAPASLSSNPDPVHIADEYFALGRHELMPVSLGTFSDNPESITDSTFESLGPAMVSEAEAGAFEGDGEYVGELVYQRLFSGGGGGGGEEPMFAQASLDDEVVYPAEWCDEKYEAAKPRCRRLRTTRMKAACWTAIMAAYATCRAFAE